MRRDAEREIKELDKRKECLRQEVEEMEAATQSLSEGVRTLWKARSDGSREEGLGSDIEGLRSQISASQARLQTLTDEQTRLSEACRDFEQGAQALENDLELLGQRW